MNRKLALALAPSLLLLGSAAVALRPGKFARADLAAMPDATNAGLQNASGHALVDDYGGQVEIRVDLGGAQLPPGTVLEGWVVDAGLLGGPGTTNASDNDEAYGTPFGNASFDEMVENAPYALSTGILDKRGNHYGIKFRINNNLTPYDAVVITLESDGNQAGYDPRPGAIMVAGPIMRMP